MKVTVEEKRRRFRELHQAGCFVIPNPWDIGSAKILEKLGFAALATSSAGSAWAVGKEDGELSVEEVLGHVRQICGATDLPINADFEGGFSDTPEGVARNVLRAIETGTAGISIEDFHLGPALLDISAAVERIRAAREAIDRTKSGVLLIGRSEGYFRGAPHIDETIKRLVAYSDAGADCLYAPAVTDMAEIREIVKAVAPKPVNVLIWGGLRVEDLAEAGVRRVSLGAALASMARKALVDAAEKLRGADKAVRGT
jgi:2-methylisocitrate lyase-like PEP mutase family enzyme